MTPAGICRFVALLVAALLAGSPAAADWLVTSTGELIETEGPWQVKGRTVVFTATGGTLSSLRLDAVDLEASRAATEDGGSIEAAPEVESRQETGARGPEPQEAEPVLRLTNADIRRAGRDRPAAAAAAAPRIVLYSTSWCGYCRKTRSFFNKLDVEFVEKDIEKDPEAQREHAALARGGGVPVVDFDGTVVRGYQPGVYRRLVSQMRAAEGAKDEGAN